MADIFIYCDGAKHLHRRVAVTNFRQINPGSWTEIPASRAPASPGTGYTMHGDSVDRPGWALSSQESVHRVDHDLVCRKCRKPWTVTEPKLFAALDAIARVGVSEVSLVGLAGTLQRQATA